MTNAQLLNALLIKLENADSSEFNDALEDILGHAEAFDRTIPVVLRAIAGGRDVSNNLLTSLLIQTSNMELYGKVRKKIFEDRKSLLELYERCYPDQGIENQLCKLLYKAKEDRGDWFNRPIVRAMGKVGSAEALPTLEAIVFELEPTRKVKEAFPSILGPEEVLASGSLIAFLKEVEVSIEDIKNRMVNVTDGTSSRAIAGTNSDQYFDNDHISKERKQPQPCITEPVIAIFRIRRLSESLAKEAYRRLGCEQNSTPARKMQLEGLLKPLRDNNAPDVLVLLLQTIQLFGNFAAHDQDDQSNLLTNEIASAIVSLYKQAVEIQNKWLLSLN